MGRGLDTSRFVNGLKRWQTSYAAAARIGLGQAAAQVLNDSVMEPPTVPIDTGTLRGSGSFFVDGKLGGTTEDQAAGQPNAQPTPAISDDFKPAPGKIVARMGYNTPYAARVHEEPMQFQDPDAGNKYLESKLREHGREYIETAAQIAKQRMGM